MKFLKDIFTESLEDGKYSSKKTVIGFLVDGFKFYDINDTMFDSILIFSATMLGVSIVKSFKTPPSDKK